MMRVRRTVFVSHFGGDRQTVREFIDQWSHVFIPKQLGVYDDEDFINSSNPPYVMTQIRKKFLGDSTVTIVLLGSCTHSRRYVDWEIKTSLRRGGYTPNGLLAILLNGQTRAHLPPRFKLNWDPEHSKYARYMVAPTTSDQLRSWIEDAHSARTSRAHLITNPQGMMKYNAKCLVHEVTH